MNWTILALWLPFWALCCSGMAGCYQHWKRPSLWPHTRTRGVNLIRVQRVQYIDDLNLRLRGTLRTSHETSDADLGQAKGT